MVQRLNPDSRPRFQVSFFASIVLIIVAALFLQACSSSSGGGGGGGNPPPAPTGLTATAGNAQVSLSWSASAGATSYNVMRGTASGGPYSSVGSPANTSYTDTGLTNGTTYYYVVTAVDANGASGDSNQASATPAAKAAYKTKLAAYNKAKAQADAITAATAVGQIVTVSGTYDSFTPNPIMITMTDGAVILPKAATPVKAPVHHTAAKKN